MDYFRKTYIEYLEQGINIIESKVDEVPDRELKNVKLPDKVYGFRFFDIIVAQVEVDGGLIELRSKRINESPVYYHKARVFSYKVLTWVIPSDVLPFLFINVNGWYKTI